MISYTNLTLDSFRTNGGCLTQKVRQHEIIKISVEINKTRNERTGKNNTKNQQIERVGALKKKSVNQKKSYPNLQKSREKYSN